jgi:hypothetical protein
VVVAGREPVPKSEAGSWKYCLCRIVAEAGHIYIPTGSIAISVASCAGAETGDGISINAEFISQLFSMIQYFPQWSILIC